MAHQIEVQNRDLAAWEAWARWPNIQHAARRGAAFGGGIVTLSLLITDLGRVFSGTSREAHPLRMLLIGAGAIALSALTGGLVSAGVAAGIRVVRAAYLSNKRRELASRSSTMSDSPLRIEQ